MITMYSFRTYLNVRHVDCWGPCAVVQNVPGSVTRDMIASK